jgi:hypothetical protein
MITSMTDLGLKLLALTPFRGSDIGGYEITPLRDLTAR